MFSADFRHHRGEVGGRSVGAEMSRPTRLHLRKKEQGRPSISKTLGAEIRYGDFQRAYFRARKKVASSNVCGARKVERSQEMVK
jgi:hypothetical protein